MIDHDLLRKQIIHEQQTGFYNRRYLEILLERELLRCFRSMQPLCLITIQVNDLRKYQRRNGKSAEGILLKKISNLIMHNIQPAGIAAYDKNEGFIIFLPNFFRSEAGRIARQISGGVEKMHIPFETEDSHEISISVGMADFPDDGRIPVDLIRSARNEISATR